MGKLHRQKWCGIGFQLGMGYVLAFLVYQLGTLFTTGALGQGFLGGLIAVAVMIGFVVYLMYRKPKESISSESEVKEAA